MSDERRQEILSQTMKVMGAIQRRADQHRMLRNWDKAQAFDKLARGTADMALRITEEG